MNSARATLLATQRLSLQNRSLRSYPWGNLLCGSCWQCPAPSFPCVSNRLSSLWFQCVASCHQKNTFTLAKTPPKNWEDLSHAILPLIRQVKKYSLVQPHGHFNGLYHVFKLLANTKLVPTVSWGPQLPGITVRFVGIATTRNTKAHLGTYRDWVCHHPCYMYFYSPL